MRPTSKAGIFSVVNVVIAVLVYRGLIIGGWLTNHYHLNDPEIINLGLVIFEPIVVLCVVAYWIWRASWLYRLISILCVVQILIGLGFLVLFVVFALTWKPRLM